MYRKEYKAQNGLEKDALFFLTSGASG
jgi:hypothetical protein